MTREKARAYSFLLLKFRMRSSSELRQRLKKKKFSAEVIEETLDFLQDKSFLDDREFARLWIASRSKKPLGLLRLRQELKAKGVGQEIIEEELGEFSRSYCESETVLEVARNRIKKIKGLEPYQAKRRLFQYLARRGFSSESINDALSRL